MDKYKIVWFYITFMLSDSFVNDWKAKKKDPLLFYDCGIKLMGHKNWGAFCLHDETKESFTLTHISAAIHPSQNALLPSWIILLPIKGKQSRSGEIVLCADITNRLNYRIGYHAFTIHCDASEFMRHCYTSKSTMHQKNC